MNDKKIQEAIEREAERQLYNIELIASENYVSRDVPGAAAALLCPGRTEHDHRSQHRRGGEVHGHHHHPHEGQPGAD